MGEGRIRVEVAFGLADRQQIYSVDLAQGATARDAIVACGVLAEFSGIDLDHHRIGVFGKPVTPGTVLRDRDRVEIYRPLLADPKEVRKRRAAQGLTKKRTAPVRPLKA
jgi:putative ubiquitin-RnfH superfamily antitoxin RatB of RatAB toxin-antitoxin module